MTTVLYFEKVIINDIENNKWYNDYYLPVTHSLSTKDSPTAGGSSEVIITGRERCLKNKNIRPMLYPSMSAEAKLVTTESTHWKLKKMLIYFERLLTKCVEYAH